MPEPRYRRLTLDICHESFMPRDGYGFIIDGERCILADDEGIDEVLTVIREWCGEQFVPGDWGYNCDGDVWIRTEIDAAAFRVRWC